MNFEEYNENYKEAILLLKDFGGCCRKVNQYIIQLKNEVFSYLVEKSLDTFLSILLLIEKFQLSDAHCLSRVLLENVVNFIYLSKFKDKISDYKSSEMKIMKSLWEKISIDTKHMKEPYKLSRLIDDEMVKDYQSAAKIAKEYRQLYGQDKWTSISFIDKATAIGLYIFYVEYKKESSLIHSNWFDHREVSVHHSFYSLVVSSMVLMQWLLESLNSELSESIDPILNECMQIRKRVIYQSEISELE